MIITKIDPKISRAARTNSIVKEHLQKFLDCDASWEEATVNMIAELVAANRKLIRQAKLPKPRLPR